MGNPNGNPGNAGGGRKSARDERLVMSVINKAWERVDANLTHKRTTEKEKDMIALEVVKRTAPKEIKFEGGDAQPVLVKIIKQ